MAEKLAVRNQGFFEDMDAFQRVSSTLSAMTSISKATIKLVAEDGTSIKKLTNININFSTNFENFRRNVETSLRLAPDDPVYELKKLMLIRKSSEDTRLIEVNQELLCDSFGCAKLNLIATVAVSKFVSPQKRAPTPGRTPSRSRSIRQDENLNNNVTPKSSARMPSPSPRTFRSFSGQQQANGIITTSTRERKYFAPSPVRSQTPGRGDKKPPIMIQTIDITAEEDNEEIWKLVHSPIQESNSLCDHVQNVQSIAKEEESSTAALTKSVTPRKRPLPASQGITQSSLFPLGMTSGEARVAYDNNIRGTRFVSPMKVPFASNIKSPFLSKKANIVKKEKDAQLPPSDFATDGRPSIATMEAQWRFLKENFTGGSSDELEWIMLCKQKKGAFEFARRKVEMFEEKYVKCLAQIEDERAKQKIISHDDQIAVRVSQIAKFDEENNEIMVRIEQESLSRLIDVESKSLTNILLVEDIKKLKALAKSISCKSSKVGVLASALLTSVFPTAHRLSQTKVIDLESKSCKLTEDIEKWTIREAQTAEYNEYVQAEEKKWLLQESVANLEALSTMRSLIPTNITEISALQVLDLVKECNGLYTYELASELKANRLLHWLVMHPDNIASYPNFLIGQSQQYFENLESLDLIELRALMAVIPEKFHNDNDGKKAAWRSRLINRAKQFVAQYRGDEVKGAWCIKTKTRLLVKLRPLKGEEMRRKIYFHHTRQESMRRIKLFESRETSLESKRGQLLKSREDAIAKKSEYETILCEMRDADLKNIYGKDIFMRAKEISKSEFANAEKRVKSLENDIKLLERSIVDREYSYSMYNQYVESLKKRHNAWLDDNIQIFIEGSFNSTPDIQKVVDEVIKCRSLDDELDARRFELDILRNNSVRTADDVVSTIIDQPYPVPGKVLDKADPAMLIKLQSMFSTKNEPSNLTSCVSEKKSKSSLIQKLVQKEETLENVAPADSHQMSFLDAIKCRANND